ncbi:MAG TPA: lysophospholipid acyltransferase family protein [Gallionellaceae bacterium]
MNYLETEGFQNPLLQPPPVNATTVAYRGVRLAYHLLYGLILAMSFPLLGPASRCALQRYWSRALLHILNVRLETVGPLPQTREQGTLLVANHISWLDVFIINAVTPASFVAKSEVRSWPLIGLLCRLTRTVFIERSLRRDTLRANWAITSTLIRGECVALFPEGTSTDGSHVRPFHSSLLQCSIDAGTRVQPIAIRYHNGTGLRSADACYIGDMTLVQSLLNILRSRSLHARLVFLPELSSLDKNRRVLANEAYLAICTALDRLPTQALPAPRNNRAHHLPNRPASSIQSAYSLLLDPLIGEAKHPHRL